MSDLSVSECLVAFIREQTKRGLPGHVLHEAKRLLLNQLKASVGATHHPAVAILHAWAMETRTNAGGAHVLWFGDKTTPEQAAAVNGALFEVLDFNETYIPCFMHAVSGVLPSVIAAAEVGAQSGDKVLTALALGIEVELACATILMPTGYFRGFIPGGITGAIGGAAACSLLMGLNDTQMRNAIGLAMNTGMGFYQSAGSMALPYVMAMTARSGLTIAKLAAKGMDAPATAFEGDKGMLSSYSDEPASKIADVLGSLGQTWRILGQSYKTVPTETITHGPIECVLALRASAKGRVPAKMRFGVEAIVVKIADERAERFGAPSNDLEAKFDLRHCTAAAWTRGRFTLDEMREPAFTDPAILDLRARTTLLADPEHKTFDGASLTIDYTDGSSENVVIPNFRGTPGNPMSDDELSAVFRLSAEGVLSSKRAEALLDAAWGLNDAPNIYALMSLAIADDRKIEVPHAARQSTHG
jgi:2-methylcitrate dehydratase PrpD